MIRTLIVLLCISFIAACSKDELYQMKAEEALHAFLDNTNNFDTVLRTLPQSEADKLFDFRKSGATKIFKQLSLEVFIRMNKTITVSHITDAHDASVRTRNVTFSWEFKQVPCPICYYMTKGGTGVALLREYDDIWYVDEILELTIHDERSSVPKTEQKELSASIMLSRDMESFRK